jgi:HEAT repeat protein
LTHSAAGGEEVAHQLELVGADAVPILIAILQDQTLHSLHRYQAAIARGQIGPRARDAIPALQDASHDEDLLIRITAVKCLARIEKSGRQQ